MSAQQFVINFLDAAGWHTNVELVSEGASDFAEKWASIENNILCRLINDRVDIPYVDDCLDMMITRVVVTRQCDGVKVCEWQGAKSSLPPLLHQQAGTPARPAETIHPLGIRPPDLSPRVSTLQVTATWPKITWPPRPASQPFPERSIP